MKKDILNLLIKLHNTPIIIDINDDKPKDGRKCKISPEERVAKINAKAREYYKNNKDKWVYGKEKGKEYYDRNRELSTCSYK